MNLEHDFTVPAPIDEAWKVLLDVERVAPCMPGATLLTVDGDDFTGTVKVKVGPIQVTYKGQAKFAELDETAHRAVIEASAERALKVCVFYQCQLRAALALEGLTCEIHGLRGLQLRRSGPPHHLFDFIEGRENLLLLQIQSRHVVLEPDEILAADLSGAGIRGCQDRQHENAEALQRANAHRSRADRPAAHLIAQL